MISHKGGYRTLIDKNQSHDELKARPLISGVAESSYECQFCTYPKVSLSPSFKNSIKEDSYPKPATSNFSVFKTRSRIGTDVIALKSFN
jgi:hypothetical protein